MSLTGRVLVLNQAYRKLRFGFRNRAAATAFDSNVEDLVGHGVIFLGVGRGGGPELPYSGFEPTQLATQRTLQLIPETEER